VSGSDDWSVRVWDVSTGAKLNMRKGPTHLIGSGVFSSEDTRISGDECSVWNLSANNWTSQQQNYLMWVPPEAQVPRPSNILTISRDGFGSVDFKQSMIGSQWVSCYTPSPHNQ
jgi:uncharacterized protein YgiB involved in biofilm formation